MEKDNLKDMKAGKEAAGNIKSPNFSIPGLTSRKLMSGMLCASMLLGTLNLSPLMVHAEETSSETSKEDWEKRCSKDNASMSQEDLKACQEYQTSQSAQHSSLSKTIKDLTSEIQNLESESSSLEDKLKKVQELNKRLDTDIQNHKESAANLDVAITQTKGQLDLKQKEIEEWEAIIKDQIRLGQNVESPSEVLPNTSQGTALADNMQKRSSTLTDGASAVAQLEELNKQKEDLEKLESGLKTLLEEKQEELTQLQEEQDLSLELQKDYQILAEEYESQLAELTAKKNAVEADRSALSQFIIDQDLPQNYLDSIQSSSHFINPVPSGRVSAGTWHYPRGGLHLGLDLAAPVGSSLIAPANGLIIYASNKNPSTGGYLGNWSGYPLGSGNFIEMLCKVGDTLYGVAFSHLSNEFMVKAGDIVGQGQVIAKTGNSGNTSGPHTHIEVYNLGNMSMKEAVDWYERDFDVTFGTNWGSANKACDGSGNVPCRERPETLLLN